MTTADKSLTVKEFDTMEVTCSVNYSGNLAPSMTWRRDDISVITGGVSSYSMLYITVSSRLTLLATANMTGKTYSCTTSFNSEANYFEAESGYPHKWTSPKINVQCKWMTNHYQV